MKIPKKLKGKELFTFLVENKEDLIYSKKNEVKFADSIAIHTPIQSKTFANKQEDGDGDIQVRAIINTTNVIDSHKDVHIDGIWTKSLSENRNIKFLQEHQMNFDKIIADKADLSVSVESRTWKSLGFDMDGKTQALTFDANIKESRNKLMFNQYKEGNVDQHSVGMRYVKLALAVNSEDEDFAQEKEVWDKYIDNVANKDEAERGNFFWAVTEAKVIEGSSVVLGSNSFTPTQPAPAGVGKEEQTENEIKANAIKQWLQD